MSATNRCILFNINAPIYALPVLSLWLGFYEIWQVQHYLLISEGGSVQGVVWKEMGSYSPTLINTLHESTTSSSLQTSVSLAQALSVKFPSSGLTSFLHPAKTKLSAGICLEEPFKFHQGCIREYDFCLFLIKTKIQTHMRHQIYLRRTPLPALPRWFWKILCMNTRLWKHLELKNPPIKTWSLMSGECMSQNS